MSLVTTFAIEVLLKMKLTAVKWRIIEMKGQKDVTVSAGTNRFDWPWWGGVCEGVGGVMTLSPLH